MDLSSITVLIVEDEANVRFTIRAMLQEMGIEAVSEATGGQQALSVLEANPNAYRLILCDWNMPGMKGIDFLREVRKTNPLISFVMITARADETSILEAKDANVTAYIRKPFSSNELKSKINLLFNRIR